LYSAGCSPGGNIPSAAKAALIGAAFGAAEAAPLQSWDFSALSILLALSNSSAFIDSSALSIFSDFQAVESHQPGPEDQQVWSGWSFL
jgi:hypothetical protein